MATSNPGHTTVLETLEKLTVATDKFVEEQSAENEAAFKTALEEHRKSLSEAKERIKATTVALTQKEFDIATPDGKLVIAKKLQEDMGNMGIKGALSCAIVGVQGTATKLHKAWVDGELFDGKNKVKEETVPKRRIEPVPADSDKAPDEPEGGTENPEETQEVVEPVPLEPVAEVTGEKGNDATGEGGKGYGHKVGEVIEGVTGQLGRLMDKIATRTSGDKAGDVCGEKTDAKTDVKADEKADK